jgi:hypothetical protein
MNMLATIDTGATLPALLDRAAAALVSAKSSAEVLEARDMARVAYDAAKSAGRLAKAKQAHDTVLAEVYRAQADALIIEARAKMRLAEEYDAAQDRGEVRAPNQGRSTSALEAPSVKDIGLTHKEIHEARQIRDAEVASPGITERVVEEIISRGEEPTKAKVHREVISKPKAEPQKVMDQSALWLWGRLKDFERDGILSKEPSFLISEMSDPMREDVKRLAPMVRFFLEQLETAV